MYGYKSFSGSQRRWCTTRRELFVIIHFATVKFSYYLLDQEFILRTNHSSLRWLDSFHDKATDVLAWWLHYLEPFRPYMIIMYTPGKHQCNSDALSRIDTRLRPYENFSHHCHLIKPQPHITDSPHGWDLVWTKVFGLSFYLVTPSQYIGPCSLDGE